MYSPTMRPRKTSERNSAKETRMNWEGSSLWRMRFMLNRSNCRVIAPGVNLTNLPEGRLPCAAKKNGGTLSNCQLSSSGVGGARRVWVRGAMVDAQSGGTASTREHHEDPGIQRCGGKRLDSLEVKSHAGAHGTGRLSYVGVGSDTRRRPGQTVAQCFCTTPTRLTLSNLPRWQVRRCP